MKLQPLSIIVILTLLIQGWAACSEDQNKKILQFNPRLESSSGTLSDKNLVQFILPDSTKLTPDQTSVGFPVISEISRDLKAILQVPLAASDLSSAIADSNQDDWRKQLESGFRQILEMRVESDDQRYLSNEIYINQRIADDVNSNMNSLKDNGGNWEISWGMNLDPWTGTSDII